MRIPHLAAAALVLFAALHTDAGTAPVRQGGDAPLRLGSSHLVLTPEKPSTVVNIRNDGTQTLSVEAKAYAWTEEANGAALVPSERLLLSPTVLTLAPGAERRLLVGAGFLGVDGEKSYRLVLRDAVTGAHAGDRRDGRARAFPIRVVVKSL